MGFQFQALTDYYFFVVHSPYIHIFDSSLLHYSDVFSNTRTLATMNEMSFGNFHLSINFI